jgi:peptidoglycan/xylan/chitin deacetylase (PgdA/CDA1 family)
MKLIATLVLVVALASAASFPRHAPGAVPASVPKSVHVLGQTSEPGDAAIASRPYDEIWHVSMDRKDIALTFDDGPYPFYTPLLLHVLERSNVHATFFVVGRSAQEFPELVLRIIASGDEVGNHTFNHVALTKLSDQAIENQILSDGTLLRQFTGQPLSLFRPPHGRFNAHVVVIAHELGYHTIFWSDSPGDVKDIPPSLIVKRVVGEATPGGIVLLHSGQYRTIEALPVIIDRLRKQGYRFVTVTQLLDAGDPTSCCQARSTSRPSAVKLPSLRTITSARRS